MDDVEIVCEEKQISDSVKIAKGTKIICKKLYLADGVIIGKNSHIQADIIRIGDYTIIEDDFKGKAHNLFEIGKHCRIMANSTIKARYVKIGDELRTFGSIIVGGGGWQDPDSKFIVGNECQIGDECFINTARPVIFKDKAALALRSVILTHGFWQSILEGYSATYGTVTLGKNCWVTTNCTILPNVTIGDNSILAAGSVVTKDIPKNCLAGGIPAHVIKDKYPIKPTKAQKRSIIFDIIKKYIPFLEIRGYRVNNSKLKEGILNCSDQGSKELTIILNKPLKIKNSENKRTLIIGFDISNYNIPNATLFNLDDLTVHGECDEESERFRNHLRRHGIVFDFKDYSADKYASKYWCILD